MGKSADQAVRVWLSAHLTSSAIRHPSGDVEEAIESGVEGEDCPGI